MKLNLEIIIEHCSRREHIPAKTRYFTKIFFGTTFWNCD